MQLFISLTGEGTSANESSLLGVVAKVLNSNIIVIAFELFRNLFIHLPSIGLNSSASVLPQEWFSH